MADNLNVPSNIEDKTILRRFLTDLSGMINSNALFSGTAEQQSTALANMLGTATLNGNFFTEVSELRQLQNNIKAYIADNLETRILQNSDDVATVSEQFGTFHEEALAAAWYGLTVKAGGVISGFTTGAIDTDTTTPGTEGSFFSIAADKFSVGKAIEDITDPAELAYVQANSLPYGTMYDANTQEIIPAFLISWNGSTYDINFNGKVSFTNVSGTDDLVTETDLGPSGTTVIDGGRITTGSISAISSNLGTINAGVIYGGPSLVPGNEEATHSMKIDLTNGSIYIA